MLFQVTIGAAATPVTTNKAICASQVTIQNNAAHAIRYGDSTASVTTPAAVNGGTAGKGMLVASGSPGGAGNRESITGNIHLADLYIAGTAGDVIDIDANV